MLPKRRRSSTAHATPLMMVAVAAASLMAAASAFLFPSTTAPSKWTQATSRPRACPLIVQLSASAAEPEARKFKTPFNPEKGARLASFSFAVYGNPSGSRFFRSKDGKSELGFHDDEVGVLVWCVEACDE
jgi:hypothetical protein